MSRNIDWRDHEHYEMLSRIDHAGLAWEWLRREAAYQDWYATLESSLANRESGLQRWGLHFRGEPRSPGFQRKRYLATRIRSQRYQLHRHGV